MKIIKNLRSKKNKETELWMERKNKQEKRAHECLGIWRKGYKNE